MSDVKLSHRIGLLSLIGLFFIVPTTRAHDYWLEKEGERFTLYQGHKHSDHGGEGTVPYSPSSVQKVQCLGSEGSLKTLPSPKTYPLRIDAKCDALAIHISSGYWTQTLTKTLNQPKSEVSGAMRGWRSEEMMKSIHTWNSKLLAPLTEGLELVPTSNVLSLKEGDKIRLLAMWAGKPKAGVAVAYQGKTRGLTGDDGQINIRMAHDGMQTVSASFEEAIQDSNADKFVHGTILQFENQASGVHR